MKVKLDQNASYREPEVLIRYSRMDRSIRRLESLVQSFDKTIRCSGEQGETWVHACDIYYAESVDKRTFVYCESSVYRTELRLYQLLAELADAGFVQVSKSCILNLGVLRGVRPLMNSRMEASLSNGERVHVTRKYVAAIRQKLMEG